MFINKVIKMRYYIINYVCALSFCFRPESLLFMSNPGHYMPKSTRSSPNEIIFTPTSLSKYILARAVLYVHCMEWKCCARKTHWTKLGGRVDSNVWVCAGVSKTILAREVYPAKPNTKPDPQYGSQVHTGLGTRSLQSIWK